MDQQIHIKNQNDGLEAVFEQNRPRLLRLATARLGNAADAEDLMQDVWLRLVRLDSGPIANPVAYLHRMILNQANDFNRHKKRSVARDSEWVKLSGREAGEQCPDPAASPERQTIDREQLRLLVADIAALPPRAQEVFKMNRIDGHSQADIAKMLNISVSAVEKHVANAMAHLMKKQRSRDLA